MAARLSWHKPDLESPAPFTEGLVSLSRGAVDVGYAQLRETAARYPDDPKGPSFLGTVEFNSGRYADAIESFRAASLLAPDVSAYSCNEGMACLMAGQSEKAFAAFLRSLHGDEILVDAHRSGWAALGSMGKLEVARRELKSALRGQPALDAKAPDRPHLRDVTLCIVDCSDPLLAVRSLRRSMSYARFHAVKFLTSLPVEEQDIETVPIAPITSLVDYSRFVMKDLAGYIDTDFALVTQWDGHVINPAAWDDGFLRFDYVGSVWDREIVPPQEGGITYNVGNGGFSLRSKAFLQAGRDPALVQVHPEDVHLCRTYREHLEQRYAIRFADEAIAHRFSFELVIGGTMPFGFHGLINVCCFEPDPRFVKFDFLHASIGTRG